MLSLIFALNACQLEETHDGKGELADVATKAEFLDLHFTGTIITQKGERFSKQLKTQLLYSVGALADHGIYPKVGHAEILDTTLVKSDEFWDYWEYDVRLPVAWSKDYPKKERLNLMLPTAISEDLLQEFSSNYDEKCSLVQGSDYSMYYYYFRPYKEGCNLNPAVEKFVLEAEAVVKHSASLSKENYPEYNRIWEDDVFRVVSLFDKHFEEDEDVAEGLEPGKHNFREFNNSILGTFVTHKSYQIDEGEEYFIVESVLDDGRRVQVVSLLVDNYYDTQEYFAQISQKTDLVIYNGHAGAGYGELHEFVDMGHWDPNQHLMMFLNGCETFAYLDQNPTFENDANNSSTLDLDVLVNATPTYFLDMDAASIALIGGLLSPEMISYTELLEGIKTDQIVIVTGEENNQTP